MRKQDDSGELAKSRIPEPVAVTGATGFIGRRLVARLVADGYRVHALALPDDPIPIEWAGQRIVVRRADVTRRGDVVDGLAGTRFVFHLAALVSDWGSPEQHARVTVGGTENVLTEAAARGQRAVLVSSIAAYGDKLSRVLCDEDTDAGAPLGPYGASKQAQEAIAGRLEGERGLQVTVVRPANVYGPGSGPWVDLLCKQLAAGAPTLVSGGDFVAALTYVDNVVDVMVRAAERVGAVGRIYNANDEHGTTWKRYVSALAELTGSPSPRSVPRVLASATAELLESSHRFLHRKERPSVTREALNLCRGPVRVPIDRARRELGYEPPVSFDDGLARVAEYLRRTGLAKGHA
jgi:nucleoside-diphosphate-sugar epimerase